jgi:hypothetical protein
MKLRRAGRLGHGDARARFRARKQVVQFGRAKLDAENADKSHEHLDRDGTRGRCTLACADMLERGNDEISARFRFDRICSRNVFARIVGSHGRSLSTFVVRAPVRSDHRAGARSSGARGEAVLRPFNAAVYRGTDTVSDFRLQPF